MEVGDGTAVVETSVVGVGVRSESKVPEVGVVVDMTVKVTEVRYEKGSGGGCPSGGQVRFLLR